MLEHISAWLKQLPTCSRLDSRSEFNDICNVIPLHRTNCFPPGKCSKIGKEKTELYLTWYAKDSFFECYHKNGSALLETAWKSIVISPYDFNGIFYLIFVDMCTLQHEIFDFRDRKSWRSSCHYMLENENRSARLFTKYKHPFNSRDFEFFAKSCGYVMCGWNSHKFLQKKIQYFKESYEILGKIKYILSNSSTAEYDLMLLQCLVRRNLPLETDNEECESGRCESEDDIEEENVAAETSEESETFSWENDNCYGSTMGNTRMDGTTRHDKFKDAQHSENVSSKVNSERSLLKYNKHKNKHLKNNTLQNSMKSILTDPMKKKKRLSSSIIGSMSHFYSENRKLKNAFVKSTLTNKMKENRSEFYQLWECVLLDYTVKENMFYFIFIDADSCYPQVMESEDCDVASCIDSCKRFLKRHKETKEVHVPIGEPFDSDNLKNYLEMQGIEFYFNSPFIHYLKQPMAAFTEIKSIILRSHSYEKKRKLLSDFVKKKILNRNIFGRKCHSTTDVSWKGNKVLAVEMSNNTGDYILLIDLEKAMVDAYPKKPNGRFIFPQEMIVAFVQAFNDLGIPKVLHTIGGSHLESREFNNFVEYCQIKHCNNCCHVKKGTRCFNSLGKVKCCLDRSPDVETGLSLWESFRKRLEISKKTKVKQIKKHRFMQSRTNIMIGRKNIYRQSKNSSESHLFSYGVGQALREMDNKKNELKNKVKTKNNCSRHLSKGNKSNHLKFSSKRGKCSGPTDSPKYLKMFDTILQSRKARCNGFNKPTKKSIKGKSGSNEKINKNRSKRVSTYKKNYGKLCNF